MAHLVTGYAGKAHIKSADDGAYNAAFFGAGQYVLESGNDNCFAGSIVDNNTVRILDGEGLMYGRHFRIEPNEYEDMMIETGTTGMNRIDLICMTYEKNAEDGKETAYLEVIKGTDTSGTAVAPSYTNGNILQGAVLNQMPLYKVTIKGVVLSKIEPMFAKLLNYEKMAEVYYQKHENLDEEYYQKFERRIEDAVDEMTGISSAVLAQVEANTAKIEALKDIGQSGVFREEYALSGTLKTGEQTEVLKFTDATDDNLESGASYSYLLEPRPGKTFQFSSNLEYGDFKNVVGYMDILWLDRNDMYLHRRYCPLFLYRYSGRPVFTCDFSINGLSQYIEWREDLERYLNGFSGSRIVMQPKFFKIVNSGTSNGVDYYSVEEFEATLTVGASVNFTAVKIGYNMAKLPNGGEIPDYSGEGTNNYEELENKPTINGVELTGDLTEEDLGIECEKDFDKASGESIHLTDAFENKVVEFSLFGKATQNGEPTPEAPIEIEVAGASGSVEAKSVGKNLLENTAVSKTINGVEFVVNEDKSVTVNGTANGNEAIDIGRDITILKSGKYIMSGNIANSNVEAILFAYIDGVATMLGRDYGSGFEFELTKETSVFYRVSVANGKTASNVTVYPMISAEGGEYQPYKESKAIINGEFAGIKVSSNGNYTDQNGQQWICDEIVKYADGSGESIQRIGVIESYNSETITGAYMSSTGELSEGAKVLYQLAEEVRTDLTAEQIAEIEKLCTFAPITNIFNDADCGMNVMYVCGENGAMISRTIDGLLEKIASLGGGGSSSSGVSSLTDLGVEATAEELNYMTNVTSDVQSQLNDKDNRLKSLEGVTQTSFVYTDTEPETVAENTIVLVYETE